MSTYSHRLSAPRTEVPRDAQASLASSLIAFTVAAAIGGGLLCLRVWWAVAA